MNEWKKARNDDITEHMLSTQIICIFVYIMAVLSVYGSKRPNLSINYLNVLGTTVFAAIIILYIGKRLALGMRLADRPRVLDISLFLTTFFLSVMIVIITGQSASPVKIIFLIPVIIASTSYGKTFGLVTAVIASAILFFFHHFEGLNPTPSVTFQTDIINSTVMLTLAWLIGGLADIEKDVREKLSTLANTDELTGLANHRHFQERMQESLKAAGDNSSPLSLIMFDIDHFKFYNDNFGHQMGDEVLKKIGSILNEVVQEPNLAARYGGEEFAVIVPGTELKALELAEQIRNRIESYPFQGAEIQPRGKLTVSLGVASFPVHGNTSKELIRSADEALYKAKYSRNRVQLYFSVMDDLREGIAETERDLFNAIKTLITIINAKDRYTFAHSERVYYYSIKMAERLDLSEDELLSLRFGSFLHDIGKIEIDRDLLNKNGPLRPSEWSILKKHPIWGSEIVRPINSLKKAIPAILYHHENFDGTGYPAGLSGEAIPLQARILRIADSFDAMTTDRPYKKAKTVSEACLELEKGKKTLFDPYLVEVFISFVIIENSEHPTFKNCKAVI